MLIIVFYFRNMKIYNRKRYKSSSHHPKPKIIQNPQAQSRQDPLKPSSNFPKSPVHPFPTHFKLNSIFIQIKRIQNNARRESFQCANEGLRPKLPMYGGSPLIA